jgi:hypothetical protein
MQISKFYSLAISLSLFLPVVAQAGEINMQAGSVKINRDSQGNTTLDTGETKLNSSNGISLNRRNQNSVIRSRNITRSNRNCNKSGNAVVTQQVTKIRGSNQRRNQTSIVSISCR